MTTGNMSRSSTRISRWDIAEMSVAVLALIASGIAIYVATSSTAESNAIAKNALEESRKANSFAEQAMKDAKDANLTSRGELRIYPRIDTRLASAEAFTVSTLEETKTASYLLRVSNKGKLPITAVRLRLYLLGGFTHQVNAPAAVVEHNSEDKQVTVPFGEQLLPGWSAMIELRIPLLTLLHENRFPFPNDEQLHKSLINVVIVPQAAGQEAPVLSDRHDPVDALVDRQIVIMKYTPRVVRSEEMKAVLCQPTKVTVFAF